MTRHVVRFEQRGVTMKVILQFTAVAAVAISISTDALAGPCDEAREGTYESNVCWLVETEFDELTPKSTMFLATALPMVELLGGLNAMSVEDRRILEDVTRVDSLDSEECTVTYTTLGERNTVRFNEVDPAAIRWETTETNELVRYTLRGGDVSSDGRSEVTFYSLSVTPERWTRAMRNLFDEYCVGLGSEF